MNKSKLLATTFAAVAFSFSAANAETAAMEHCKVTKDESGKVVKAEKADCKSATANTATEMHLEVATGECDKIVEGKDLLPATQALLEGKEAAAEAAAE
jgi:hypothetical protein